MFPNRIAPAIVLLGLVLGSWFAAGATRLPVLAMAFDHRVFMPVSASDGGPEAQIARTRRPAPTATPVAPPSATPAPTATTAPTSVPTALPTAVPTALPTALPTAVPTTLPTALPTALPTIVPTTVPTASPTPTPLPTGEPHWWGLLGNDGAHLTEEYAAGIRYKLFTLRWREFMPNEGSVDTAYVNRKLTELANLRSAGFQVLLTMGIHDAPAWVHSNYPNSYYVNQYGETYTDGLDDGDANFVFNPKMRELAEAYIGALFTRFGTDFAAVRVGAGRYGELTYPPAKWNGRSNVYWDFDPNAQAQSPVPGWKPGSASPQGEAGRFLDWHLQKLVELQNWEFSVVRRHFTGRITILYPSWGIRPGDIDKAVATNLNGSSSAEINGEIQRGFDFARQITSITDPQAIVTTTWLDADGSRDGGSDPRYWSPVHYLWSLAQAHPLRPAMYGENTGHGSAAVMDFTAAQMSRYGLLGFAWYNEAEILSGTYATLADYRAMVDRYGP